MRVRLPLICLIFVGCTEQSHLVTGLVTETAVTETAVTETAVSSFVDSVTCRDRRERAKFGRYVVITQWYGSGRSFDHFPDRSDLTPTALEVMHVTTFVTDATTAQIYEVRDGERRSSGSDMCFGGK